MSRWRCTHHDLLPHAHTSDFRAGQESVVRCRDSGECRQEDEARDKRICLIGVGGCDSPKSRPQVEQEGADQTCVDHEWTSTGDVEENDADRTTNDAYCLAYHGVCEGHGAQTLLDVECWSIGLHLGSEKAWSARSLV